MDDKNAHVLSLWGYKNYINPQFGVVLGLDS